MLYAKNMQFSHLIVIGRYVKKKNNWWMWAADYDSWCASIEELLHTSYKIWLVEAISDKNELPNILNKARLQKSAVLENLSHYGLQEFTIYSATGRTEICVIDLNNISINYYCVFLLPVPPCFHTIGRRKVYW